MKFTNHLLTLIFILSSHFITTQAYADKAVIAVASNFTKTIEAVNEVFVKEYPQHSIKFAFGPTGKLFAQIKNGAPYGAFFAADEYRAKLAIQEAKAIEQSYFVYAQGKIVLYSSKYPVAQSPLQTLKNADFRYIAIANPKTAPYGERAQAYLKQKGLYKGLKSKIVNGESIAHAFQYVATGNAPIGFIALSQVLDPESPVYKKGEYWEVPQVDYEPINQAAVITSRGKTNQAVIDFMKFMQTPNAVNIIKSYGYGVL